MRRAAGDGSELDLCSEERMARMTVVGRVNVYTPSCLHLMKEHEGPKLLRSILTHIFVNRADAGALFLLEPHV